MFCFIEKLLQMLAIILLKYVFLPHNETTPPKLQTNIRTVGVGEAPGYLGPVTTMLAPRCLWKALGGRSCLLSAKPASSHQRSKRTDMRAAAGGRGRVLHAGGRGLTGQPGGGSRALWGSVEDSDGRVTAASPWPGSLPPCGATRPAPSCPGCKVSAPEALECAGERAWGRRSADSFHCGSPAHLHAWLCPWLLGLAGGAEQVWRCRLEVQSRPRGTQAASGRPACSLRNLPWSFPRAKDDRMEELPVGSLGTPGARAVPRALTDAVRPGPAVRLSPGGQCWVLARVSAAPACAGVGREGSRPAPSLPGLPPRAWPLLEPTPQASGKAPRSAALLDGCVRRSSLRMPDGSLVTCARPDSSPG